MLKWKQEMNMREKPLMKKEEVEFVHNGTKMNIFCQPLF